MSDDRPPRVVTWERDGEVGRQVLDRPGRPRRDGEDDRHRMARGMAADPVQMIELLADISRLHRQLGDTYPDIHGMGYGPAGRSLGGGQGSGDTSSVESAITELGGRARAADASVEITRQVKAAVRALESALGLVERVQGASLGDQARIRDAVAHARKRANGRP